MSNMLGKVFDAIKNTIGNINRPDQKKREASAIRPTESVKLNHGPTPYGRATTKGAFGSPRRNKLARKSIRRYGLYAVMMAQAKAAQKVYGKDTPK